MSRDAFIGELRHRMAGLPQETVERTVEYYGDPLGIRLIGAVEVPRKRMNEDAARVGKLLCKVHGKNELEAVMVDADGEEIDRVTVFR